MDLIQVRFNWPAIVRVVGYCNLVFAAITFLSFAFTIIGYHGLPNWFFAQEAPFAPPLIRSMLISSAVILIGLVVTGSLLLRSSRIAMAASVAFFCGEVALFVILIVRWHFPLSPLSLVVILPGFMNLGVALQIVTAYPAVAAVCLLAARHKSDI